jgi:phosphate starvation-inducible PhoH-like protein
MSQKRKNNPEYDNWITENTLPATTTAKLNKAFKAKTNGQHEYVRAIIESVITFCVGPAGTGKTACAVGLACEQLIHGKTQKIVISRPVIETGRQGLGFLPGTLEEKIHPYLIPILDELNIYLGKARTNLFLKDGTIRIVPLEYMRGYNLHNSFVILDEGQNATFSQIKMLLTRVGRESKIIINGDLDQSDLYDDEIGLSICMNKLQNVRDISIIELNEVDIIRNSIIARILEKLK